MRKVNLKWVHSGHKCHAQGCTFPAVCISFVVGASVSFVYSVRRTCPVVGMHTILRGRVWVVFCCHPEPMHWQTAYTHGTFRVLHYWDTILPVPWHYPPTVWHICCNEWVGMFLKVHSPIKSTQKSKLRQLSWLNPTSICDDGDIGY